MYASGLIVKVIIFVSFGPLNDIQPHIMNEVSNLLFFPDSHLYIFVLNAVPDKNSSIIVLANADSWFITEFFTLYVCFSFVNLIIISSCLC